MSSIRNVSVVGLVALLCAGCTTTQHHATTRPAVDRSEVSNIYLSRTKGQRGKHFSSRVAWSNGTFIQAPKVILGSTSGALPPGLSMSDRGVITGTPTQSGFWSLVFRVNDRYKGTTKGSAADGWAWQSHPLEIKIFDKLTDER